MWRRGTGSRSTRFDRPCFFVRREKFLYPDMQPIGCMSTASVTIDPLLGEIASLPLQDQALLHEVIGHRLDEARRREIADEAAAALDALERGEVRRGTTADLSADLESVAEPIAPEANAGGV